MNKIKITIFNTFHKSNGNGNGKDSCRDIRHKKDVQGINGIVMLDLVPIDVHMRLRPSTKNMVLLKGQIKEIPIWIHEKIIKIHHFACSQS